MKKLFIAMVAFMAVACTTVEHNPLMKEFSTPNETPLYSKIKNEHFYPAFIKALETAKKEVDMITENPESPTFENTIEAMEYSGADLEKVSGIFFNLLSSNKNDTLEKVSFEVMPMLTEFGNMVSMNEKLFERVKAVYQTMEDGNLTNIQKELTKETYLSFARNGAELKGNDKTRYAELTTKLSTLSLKFDKNTMDARKDFVMELSQSDVDALPLFVVEMAKEDAKAKGIDGWIITLQAPSYGAFMQYSPNRELKEKIWKASNTLCIGGAYDNTAIVNEIVNARLEIANLLGYETYADYVLENNMAKSSNKVNIFLKELSDKSLGYARKDIENISKFAKANGANHEIMQWDLSYWADKLKEDQFSISDEQLKPYFKLESVRDGIFTLCSRLYGVDFTENKTAEPYHKDVMIYDVIDADGKLLTTLYLDFFPRSNKGSGAWMNTIRDQKIQNGIETRPLVTVVCNFTKPTETTPSLLTFGEVVTFLHEFGHAMHGTFATGAYASLSGTSVARDFVELPSQIMENWATEEDFLTMFAKHYQTGEIIPTELIDKIIASKNFNAGYQNVRQLSFGLSDMAWHSIKNQQQYDVVAFESDALKEISVLPAQAGTAFAPSFGHIFSGGYAAGYYSYKWAEVLEADAFEEFKSNGVFDRATGERFRESILSKGSSTEAMELYVNFRGAEPDPNSLFKKYGME